MPSVQVDVVKLYDTLAKFISWSGSLQCTKMFTKLQWAKLVLTSLEFPAKV